MASKKKTTPASKTPWIIAIGVVLITLLIGAFWNDIAGVWKAFGPTPTAITSLIKQNNSLLSLPQGFSISIFAEGMQKPRVLQKDPNGVLFVTDMDAGVLYALPDNDHDGKADEKKIILSDLNKPHGFLFDNCNEENCTLYIAEENKIMRWAYRATNQTVSSPEEIVTLPTGGNHKTRSLLMDPNDPEKLLVSIGSTCNVCIEKDNTRGTIQYIDLTPDEGETYELKPYATGLRNAVFLNLNPATDEIWATEMGRDKLGDDIPPDEINSIEERSNYGWPQCYGDNIHDTEFDKDLYQPREGETVCELLNKTPAHINLQAHSAPLGFSFVTEQSPLFEKYPYDMFIAYHGSWNRSVPTGYKVVRFDLDENGDVQSREDFITGWLEDNGESIGRPVDIELYDNGDMYISDDKAGVVYRVTMEQVNSEQ